MLIGDAHEKQKGGDEIELDWVNVTKDDADITAALDDLQIAPVDHDDKSHAVVHKVGWVRMGYIMTSELIGMGVLSLPAAFQTLGWVPAIITVSDPMIMVDVTHFNVNPPPLPFYSHRCYSCHSRQHTLVF